MRENGPAIYRWVNERKGITSPGVTEELVKGFSFAPFGAGSVHDTSTPAINRWAISIVPAGLFLAVLARPFSTVPVFRPFPHNYCRPSLREPFFES